MGWSSLTTVAPVSRFDARLLARGMEELRERAPERASAIEARAREAVVAFSDGYPGDVGTGLLAQDVDALDAFLGRHGGRACPALDPESLECDLYAHRPVPCRTFGPPLRFGDENAPHCDLCFRGASREEIERCRIEPDPEDLEQTITRAVGAPGDESWDTLIAVALIRK
jgi:Fe-S-cluster containining protein